MLLGIISLIISFIALGIAITAIIKVDKPKEHFWTGPGYYAPAGTQCEIDTDCCQGSQIPGDGGSVNYGCLPNTCTNNKCTY